MKLMFTFSSAEYIQINNFKNMSMEYKSTEDMDCLIDQYLKGEMSDDEQNEFIGLLRKDKCFSERAYLTALLIITLDKKS